MCNYKCPNCKNNLELIHEEKNSCIYKMKNNNWTIKDIISKDDFYFQCPICFNKFNYNNLKEIDEEWEFK